MGKHTFITAALVGAAVVFVAVFVVLPQEEAHGGTPYTNGDGVWSADERPGPPPGRGRARHGESMDADGDGVITFEEAGAVMPGLDQERFDLRDTNGDGVWSADERPGPPPGQGPGRHGHPMDADGDLKDDERPRIGRGDRRGPGRGRGPSAMDANADGQVTFGEAVAAQPELTREQFDARDQNGDGVWSRDDRPEGFGGQRGRGGQRGGGRRLR